jgi:hypothetical protein
VRIAVLWSWTVTPFERLDATGAKRHIVVHASDGIIVGVIIGVAIARWETTRLVHVVALRGVVLSTDRRREASWVMQTRDRV